MLSDSKNSLDKIFKTSKVSDAFGDLQGIQKVVAIMILNILFPSLASKLKAFSPIPLNSFRTSLNILNFIKAVIKSGLTADVERGVVFVLGSSGVGKTSFVNTLKEFIDNPDKTPIPFLSGEHPDLLETEILEVYDEISLQQDRELSVVLTKKEKGASNIRLVDEDEEHNHTGARTKKLNLKLVDLGGHQEYYSCSSLFISSSGVFLVAFDSQILNSEDIDKHYLTSVGTYIDLI